MAIPESKLEFLRPPGEGETPFEQSSFKKLTLRDKGTGAEIPFEVGSEIFSSNWMTCDGSPFFRRDGLWVAFFQTHHGSGIGHGVSAIDLLGRRVVSLGSLSPAILCPHGNRAGFFSVVSERYEELPGTDFQVNCLYLDWWDKDFKRVRFARALSLFGGASARAPGEPQLDIPFDADLSTGY
jgi:hypothetical protein